MRALLRFLVGMEDFARVNGHYKRRATHRSLLAEDAYKRLCLSCLVRRRCYCLDSEWHALFECPLNAAPRALFTHVFPLSLFGYTDESSTSFLALLKLTMLAHSDESLTNEFALWVVGTLACRKREFRALTPS